LQVAIKTVVFQSDLVDAPISRVASETVIASNLIHPNIVATYSHDISAVGKTSDGEPELGVYKFYLIQVSFKAEESIAFPVNQLFGGGMSSSYRPKQYRGGKRPRPQPKHKVLHRISFEWQNSTIIVRVVSY
jgi:hypothetical protein